MSWFPKPVEPARRVRRPPRLHAPAQPRAADRRRARGAGDDRSSSSSSSSIRKINTAPPPQIIYVESCTANRTDAEIIADQKKDQAERDAARKGTAAAIPEARKPARACERATTRFMAEAVALAEAARAARPRPIPMSAASSSRTTAGSSAAARPPPGGRPHAEAVALGRGGQASDAARPSTSRSSPARMPASAARPAPTCWSRAEPARVVIALKDPDPRTAGKGIARLRAAGIEVKLGHRARGRRGAAMAGWLTRHAPRPAADHAQAGAVDRRQDRAAVGRIEMDHRRGCARAMSISSAPART